MPEAVTTTAGPFAPPKRGRVSSSEEAPVPHEPMHTPHPTSAAHPATCSSPRRSGRRGRLALAGALVLLVLLAVAGPAAAFTSQYAFTISGHGWGHGIGMSQWGAYGYAKHGWTYKAILKHYYTGISFTNVEDSVVRVNLRSGLGAVKLTCPNEYTVQGTGRRVDHPRRHDRDHDLDEQRLQGRRRDLRQGLHRRPDLHAVQGRAAPDHQDGPRRRRRLPRHDQGHPHERRPHDAQQGAARELPARRGPARGVVDLATGGAPGAGLRRPRLRAGQPPAGQVMGRLLRRPRPGLRRRRHRASEHQRRRARHRRRLPELRRQADPGHVLLQLGRPHREHRARVAGSVDDPLSQGRRRPLRHVCHAARLGTAAPHAVPDRRAARAPPGLPAPSTPWTAARPRASSRRRSSAAAAPSTSTAAPCA